MSRPAPGPASGTNPGPLSALPSAKARAAAFAAIIVAGLCGGLIGYALVILQCRGECATPGGIGAVVGALLGAGGVAVVAVVMLRAMSEWRTIKEAEAGQAGSPD